MSSPRVLVIFNEPVLSPDHPDYASEVDVLDIRDDVIWILEEGNFQVESVGFSKDPAVLLDALKSFRPDAVFNLFEGLANQNATEISCAGLLEWMNVSFTGSSASAIALGRDKVRTKFLLQGAGLPTPRFQVVELKTKITWPYNWPAMVKPITQDASIGISQKNVVTNEKDLAEQVERIGTEYGEPVLVEEYIDGREFHIHVLEDYESGRAASKLSLTPLIELRFDYNNSSDLWPIYTYSAKWLDESKEFNSSFFDLPVYLEPKLMEEIQRVALGAFRCIGLRDYSRLDIRLSEKGVPYILEVNPNPYLLSYFFQLTLEAMGRSLHEQVRDLARNALFRAGRLTDLPSRPSTHLLLPTKSYRQESES